MLFMLDNYDSFVYNLYQYFGMLGETIEVRRRDVTGAGQRRQEHCGRIIHRPGRERYFHLPTGQRNCPALTGSDLRRRRELRRGHPVAAVQPVTGAAHSADGRRLPQA